MEEKKDDLKKSSGGQHGEAVEEEEAALPGFRFHPTDEELVGFYLRRKVEKKPISIDIIKQIDIYKYDPWDLPKVSTVGDKEWYFFCLRGRKYRNSIRPNRVTGSGFWKATGIDRPITAAVGGGSGCIGLKKSLVYYRGSAGKGTKTDWMMHEFRIPSGGKNIDTDSPTIQEAEIWTICRIFKRNSTYKKYAQVWKGSSSKQIPTDASSITSSFESDTGDEHKHFGASMATTCIEGSNQLLAQAHFAALQPNTPNPGAGELYNEGSWDELGRIMEFMMDPLIVYECRSS